MGFPQEVAEGIYFLASEAASYITGSILRIDGGLLE
ncbi:MAG: SDR family oxidoreductase [Clostridia bacterium]